MPQELVDLFQDQDLTKLRISRPSKPIFLCGGALSSKAGSKPANLRDYLLRFKPLKSKHPIVRAESAVQVYRDSDYPDLISLEEDLAQISAIVLVIAESAGSLAELGAFSSSPSIKPSLRVIIQKAFFDAESFVRHGPIRRIALVNRSYVGVYPWSLLKNGQMAVTSLRGQTNSMKKFIRDHVDNIPKSRLYSDIDDSAIFYVLYWIIYLCLAVSEQKLYEYAKLINPALTNSNIRNKLYCMELAEWVEIIGHGGADYFVVLHDQDPFDYSFKNGTADKDSTRRKLAVTTALRRAENVDRYVLAQASQKRQSPK